MLNGLDQELEPRGLRFVRYADDCSISVKGKRSAERVLRNTTRYIEDNLHLHVNKEKTSIYRPITFHMLGYNFVSSYKRGVKGKYQLRVSPERFGRMEQKVKEITRKKRRLSFSDRITELNSYMNRAMTKILTHTNMIMENLFRLHKVNKLNSWRAPYNH